MRAGSLPTFLKAWTVSRGTLTKSPARTVSALAEAHLELPLGQVEGLCLGVVDMRRRSAAGRDERLELEVAAARLLARGQERVEVSGAPERRPRANGPHVGTAGGECGSFAREARTGASVNRPRSENT